MTTEQYQIGYEAGYSDGFDAGAAQPAQNEWKEAVLEQLAAHSIDAPVGVSPTVILAKIIHTAVMMATDPAINAAQPAHALNWSELVAWWESGAEQWEGLRDIVSRMASHAHAIDTSRRCVEKQAGDVQVPEGWREFIENVAKAGSEPLNSLAGGSDKASRRHWLGVIRNRARDLLAAAPSTKEQTE